MICVLKMPLNPNHPSIHPSTVLMCIVTLFYTHKCVVAVFRSNASWKLCCHFQTQSWQNSSRHECL